MQIDLRIQKQKLFRSKSDYNGGKIFYRGTLVGGIS